VLLLDLIRGDSTVRPEVPRLFSGSSGTLLNHQTPTPTKSVELWKDGNMNVPYAPGDQAAWLELDDDGLHVTRAWVKSVEAEGNRWRVETTYGTELVNDQGEGRELVPIDNELELEFAERGDHYHAPLVERPWEPLAYEELNLDQFSLGEG